MKKLITIAAALATTVLLYSGPAAAVSAEVTINRITPAEDGMAYLAVSPALLEACSTSAGDHLKFDMKSTGGKAIFATLLSAKLTNKKIHVGYTAVAANLVGAKNCSAPELPAIASVSLY